MYLPSSLLVLLLVLPCCSAFVIQPSTMVLQQPTTKASSTSSSALFGSRKRDKIASRTAWLKKRGSTSTSSASARSETATSSSSSAAAAAGLHKNEAGLDYVQLVHPDTGDSAQIYQYGACVTSYVKDNQEYIAVRPDAKMDGSKPISGGLSHCWPQFGPGEIQQHGFARNVNWELGAATMSDTSVEMILQPSDYTKEMWDKQFQVRFTVTLEADQLVTEMVVENTSSNEDDGSEAFDFQAALHSYFTVSSLENLQITGSFAGKEFLNKIADETQTEDRDVITIAEEYDRVYKGVNDPVLNDQGTGKSLAVLNKEGWEDTVIWNPYGNEGMGYNNFVCVESVKFDPVTLEAGKTWTGVMALKPASL